MDFPPFESNYCSRPGSIHVRNMCVAFSMGPDQAIHLLASSRIIRHPRGRDSKIHSTPAQINNSDGAGSKMHVAT